MKIALRLFVLACIAVLAPIGVFAADDAPQIDSGATAWMLTSTALVLLMVPGLAMFYGGLAAKLCGVPAIASVSAFACLSRKDTQLSEFEFYSDKLRHRIRNCLCGLTIKHLVAVSDGLGRAFIHRNRIGVKKLVVIPYGVKINGHEFPKTPPERELWPQDGSLIIGAVGRLITQKDYPTLLLALERLLSRGLHVRLVIVGDGPLRFDLDRQAEALNISGRVHFLGYRDDVQTLLRQFDVYVMNSCFEPYGVALLEAMAEARAIVATSVNEIPEIVGHGAAALLVPPSDPGELANALGELVMDADRRKAYGQAALEFVQKRNSLDYTLRQYESLYFSTAQ